MRSIAWLILVVSSSTFAQTPAPQVRTVSPDGKFSVVLPDGWTSGPRGRFVPPEGTETSVAIAVTYKPFTGSVDALLKGYEASMKAAKLDRKSRKKKSVGGASWTTDLWESSATPLKLTVYGRSAVTKGRGIVLSCGSSPERQPPPEQECGFVLSSFKTGDERPEVPEGFQVIGADGWSAILPADWTKNPNSPMPMYTSPRSELAPIFVNVTDRKIDAARGDPKTPVELVQSMASALNANVDAQDLAKLGDTEGIVFILGAAPKLERAFFTSRSSVHKGQALSLVCGGRSADSYDADKALCLKVIESLRWEQ